MDFSKSADTVSNGSGKPAGTKVFMGGSKTISVLGRNAKKKINEFVSSGAEILVGDCRGADTAVQNYLYHRNYRNVTVYATGGKARNNIGKWSVVNVPSNGETGYEYYKLKDLAMIDAADEGFMIWDGESRGTGNNIEELEKRGKKVTVIREKPAVPSVRNPNEYIADGKRFIREISKCSCEETVDGDYVLTCRIKERGEHDYCYSPGSGYIKKQYTEKKLWLGQDAEKAVEKAAEEFDTSVAEFLKSGCRTMKMADSGVTVYYRKEPDNRYDALIEFGDRSFSFIHPYSIGTFVSEITLLFTLVHIGTDGEPVPVLGNYDEKTIEKNPFYISAGEHDDELMKKELRLYYNIATAEECEWLAACYGERVLPPLPEEYDRYYAVDGDTLDLSLLLRSGYNPDHRPNFAMTNSTRCAWQLNPHTKNMVDAAYNNMEVISFKEYLEMFDKSEKKDKTL